MKHARLPSALLDRSEQEIQREILTFLRRLPGVVAWKTGGGLLPLANGRRVRMGHKGVSDIVGWCSEESPIVEARPVARFLAIEVKRLGEKCTPEQAAFLDAVLVAGGIAIVASSVDDVRRALLS